MKNVFKLFYIILLGSMLFILSCTEYRSTTCPTYRVFYNGNGADGLAADLTNYIPGSEVTLLDKGTLTKVNYVFIGWSKSKDATSAEYTPGDKIKIANSNITLYAIWGSASNTSTYILTYDKNSPTAIGDLPTDTTAYKAGDSVTVKDHGNLTNVGFTFGGWNKLQNGSGTNYTAGSTFLISNTNITLYANWAATTYTVRYHTSSTTETGTPPADTTLYKNGDSYTVLGNIGTSPLDKAGWVFSNWNTMQDGAGLLRAPGVAYSIANANVDLYSVYKVRIVYDANGGGGTAPTEIPQDVDATLALKPKGAITAPSATPTYVFGGWSRSTDGSSPYAAGATYTVPNESPVTFYAVWAAPVTYTVTYSKGSETTATGAVPVDNNRYLQGDTVIVLDGGNLAVTGKKFTGWSDAQTPATTYTPMQTFVMGAANVTLNAEFKNTYTITYDANNATTGTAPTDSNVYLEGEIATIKSDAVLARTGYLVQGWNTAADGTGTDYAVNQQITIGTANLHLYAKWIVVFSSGKTWIEEAPSASFSTRNSPSSVVFNGKLWVIGGYGSELKNDVWSSPDGQTWTEATSKAAFSARQKHTSAVFNSKLWVIGGNDGAQKNDVWSSDDGQTWTEVKAQAGFTARSMHTTVVFKNKLWVIGGFDGTTRKNDVWSSDDGQTWTEVKDQAGFTARIRHTTVEFNNKLWVIGGFDGAQKNDVWSSDDGINWTQVTGTAAFTARQFHTSVVYNNKLWVIGGYSGFNNRNDVWSSTDGNTWTEATNSAEFSIRNSHTSVVFNNRIWVIGGTDGTNDKNDVWRTE